MIIKTCCAQMMNRDLGSINSLLAWKINGDYIRLHPIMSGKLKDKIVVLWLLFCLVGPVIIAVSWLEYKRIMVRRHVKIVLLKTMDKEELVLIKLTRNEAKQQLDWEYDDEFEYHDEMYDLVELETHGDTLYYWCWSDHEETALMNQIDHILVNVLSKDTKRKEDQKRFMQYLKNTYYHAPFDWRGFDQYRFRPGVGRWKTEIRPEPVSQ